MKWHRFILIILLAVFLPAYTAAADTGTDENGLRGDVNEDGFVTVCDGIRLAQFLAKAPGAELTGQGLLNADVNADGQIDITDLVILMQYLTYPERFAWHISEPEEERPDPGDVYLAALFIAGVVYDQAIEQAQAEYEAADSTHHAEALETYAQARNEARTAYDDTVSAARIAYNAAMGY